MPTLLRKLPTENPDSVGLAAIVLPTPEEEAVYAIVGNWWRADSGLGATAWTDRKAGIDLVKMGPSMPTAVTKVAYSGNLAVDFVNLNYALGADGVLSTTDSFSIVTVGRAGSGDNAFLWGSGAATNQTKIAQLTSGAVTFNMNAEAATATNVGTYTRVYADGPFIGICSFDNTAHKAAIRLDRGRWAVDRTANTPNANAHLTVGAAGPVGGLGGAIDGGDIAEVLYFPFALLSAAHAADLALVESYLGLRYGITAP